MAASRFGASDLPTDWVSLRHEQPAPAKGFSPTFGYNAIRIPLYIAWSTMGQNDALGRFVFAPGTFPTNNTSGDINPTGSGQSAANPLGWPGIWPTLEPFVSFARYLPASAFIPLRKCWVSWGLAARRRTISRKSAVYVAMNARSKS